VSTTLAFLSYSSEDADTALALTAALRQHGVDVWIDLEQIRVGDSIPSRISDGLSRCDVILVLISSSFIRSSWSRQEYEPLLMREIEADRVFVIPILLDDTEMPMLLSQKRHLDLRGGLNEEIIEELATTILTGRSVTKVQRLLPEPTASYHCSLLAMVISSVISDFPVSSIADEELLQGRSLLDLFKTIETLIHRFEELCDEILQVLTEAQIEDDFYGSAYRIAHSRILRANRKLLDIARSMRDISSSLDGILRGDSALHMTFNELLEICAAISVAEDFLVIDVGAPPDLPQENPPGKRPETRGAGIPDLPLRDNVLSPIYFDDLGEKMVSDFNQVLGELSMYRADLRRTIARLAAAET
jgi:hypothetical protein